ncbi:hypothetical protein IKC_01157 [Bacillus cereus VD184]|uniref:DUF4177 domain-containing protein n=2 Tax=Bacillus cereus TaxID=1396 RepID=A0A9W5R2Y9_BACCE|nr:hypothetical protein IKC_01157 [Bacillus cereus VD184]
MIQATMNFYCILYLSIKRGIQMFEYKFVKVELHWGFTRSKPAEDYQEIIQEHARNGWRFVQIVAPTIGSSGQPEYFDLIFEKKISL